MGTREDRAARLRRSAAKRQSDERREAKEILTGGFGRGSRDGCAGTAAPRDATDASGSQEGWATLEAKKGMRALLPPFKICCFLGEMKKENKFSTEPNSVKKKRVTKQNLTKS